MVLQMGSLEEQYVIEEDECLLNRGPTDRKVLYLGAAPNRYYPFSLFSEDCGWKEIGNIVLSRTKVVFFSNKINLLVPCGPLAVLVDLVTGHQVNCTFVYTTTCSWYLCNYMVVFIYVLNLISGFRLLVKLVRHHPLSGALGLGNRVIIYLPCAFIVFQCCKWILSCDFFT